VRNVGTAVDGWTLSAHYRQTQNIALTPGWTPIGTDANRFTGTFNGGGFTISNLVFTPTAFGQGMFGVIGEGGRVENLILTGVNITSPFNRIGSIAGDNYGTISSCRAEGSISAVGSVGNFGGIAGENRGTGRVEYSSSHVTVTSTAAGAGGIAGNNIGTIAFSYATGNVTSTAGDNVGGIAGGNQGTINNVFASGAVSGGDNVGGIAGSPGSSSTTTNSVALNPSVVGTGTLVGRITGSVTGTRTNNHAVTMTVTSGGTVTLTSLHNGIHGQDFTNTNQASWSAAATSGPAFVFGTSASAPWVWDGDAGNNRPKLWWE
jgi:hypothetical protein